jgi:hypothetical protein
MDQFYKNFKYQQQSFLSLIKSNDFGYPHPIL